MLLGRQRWVESASSTANAEKEIIHAAPGDVTRQYLVTGYMTVLRAAVAVGDVLVTIEDEDDNVLWVDYFGDAAVRGTRIGFNFGEEDGLIIPIGKGCKLVVAAAGAGAIVTGNIKGLEF